jgi:ribosomal protein S16
MRIKRIKLESTDVNKLNMIKNDPAFKKFKGIVNKYGYEVHHAMNRTYSNGDILHEVGIYNPKRDRYTPDIYFDSFNDKPKFQIQTTSYGALDEKEYKLFIDACNRAYNLIVELNKFDLDTLPNVGSVRG